MRRLMILLLAALSFCMVSCNAKTEKMGEKLYEFVKKPKPGIGKAVKAVKPIIKPKPEPRLVKTQCKKCNGGGSILVVDCYGNYILQQCNECRGSGYVYIMVYE